MNINVDLTAPATVAAHHHLQHRQPPPGIGFVPATAGTTTSPSCPPPLLPPRRDTPPVSISILDDDDFRNHRAVRSELQRLLPREHTNEPREIANDDRSAAARAHRRVAWAQQLPLVRGRSLAVGAARTPPRTHRGLVGQKQRNLQRGDVGRRPRRRRAVLPPHGRLTDGDVMPGAALRMLRRNGASSGGVLRARDRARRLPAPAGAGRAPGHQGPGTASVLRCAEDGCQLPDRAASGRCARRSLGPPGGQSGGGVRADPPWRRRRAALAYDVRVQRLATGREEGERRPRRWDRLPPAPALLCLVADPGGGVGEGGFSPAWARPRPPSRR